MTYTLTLTPYLAAMLDAACRAAGLDTLSIFPAHLTRHTAPATTTAVAVEEPAGICQPPRAPLPVPVPPSLRGPGEPIPDPGNIDWDDPETYR